MDKRGDTKMIAAFLAFAGAVMFLRIMTYHPVQLAPGVGSFSSGSGSLYILFGILALLVLSLVVAIVYWYVLPSGKSKNVPLSMQMRKFNSLQGQIERALEVGLTMKAASLYDQMKKTYALLSSEEQQRAKSTAERVYKMIVESHQKLANGINN